MDRRKCNNFTWRNYWNNAVIAGGAVVVKDVPAWSVVAGNPARVIRQITEEDRGYFFRINVLM